MEITFKKTKIKSPEKEMKNIKNEKITLGENILTHRKIIENLSGNNKRKTTNSPIKDKKKKVNGLNTNKFNWQTSHFTKNSNKIPTRVKRYSL